MSDLIRREDAVAAAASLYKWSIAAGEELEASLRILPAVQPDAREAALRDIARQKKTDEMDTEYDVEYADFEGGYNAIIDVARRALPAVQPDAREAALREALEAVNAKWRSGADTPDEVRGLALAEAAILDLIEGQQS